VGNTYKYQKIDAFTSGGSLGNPAACLYLAEGQRLSDREMLDIAKQHKGFVSEVVYCAREGGEILLTYYSSECEVDFCGHGTIACMIGLIREDPALLRLPEIPVRTRRKGGITVYNRLPEQGAVFISAPEPSFPGAAPERRAIAEALGLGADAIDPGAPVDLIDAGLRTLIVPLKGLAAEITVFPEEARLKRFCEARGIDIVLIFSTEVRDRDNCAHTRVFAPRFGYLEDPATGSGSAAFGHYLLKYALWDGRDISVEQGGCDRVFNRVFLTAAGGDVRVGGSATVRIEGVYHV
jgi:PhzF family phenazine biosynthesis protein